MAWPEPVHLLLAQPDSRASQALRWGLRGLQASLQAVLQEVPQDPGSAQLRALLAELEGILDPSVQEGTEAAAIPAAHGPRLVPLARTIALDGRFQALLERSPIPEGTDDEIWNGVQRLLLRVPPHLAEEWRHRSQEFAGQAGGRLDEWAAVVLPLPWDEAIYPGVTGEIRAAGLRSSPTAALDPRITAPADEELRGLAQVTSTCLWFVDHDPHLCHCLKSVFRFGVPPLSGEQRERYVAELLRLWERVRTSPSLTLRVGVSPTPTRSVSEGVLETPTRSVSEGVLGTPTRGVSEGTIGTPTRSVSEGSIGTPTRSVSEGSIEAQATPPRQQLKEHLKALLDLDEALHSLLYQPPAAADSWWGRLLDQARQALFLARDRAVEAGGAVHLQLLGGNFADINRLAPDSLQVDFGVPGEVSHCLRIWARIDGEELKGRVLYRSPEAEA